MNSFCDLQEDNQWKKESYEACWLSLILETRPQYKLTLSETDSVHRESYKQQQVVHFSVQWTQNQTLRLSSNNRVMTEQLPIFNTSRDLHRVPAGLEQEQGPDILSKGTKGVDGREVTPTATSKPARVNYRVSSFMSSPREVSYRVQRRE